MARPHNSGGVVVGNRLPRPLVYAPRGRGFLLWGVDGDFKLLFIQLRHAKKLIQRSQT